MDSQSRSVGITTKTKDWDNLKNHGAFNDFDKSSAHYYMGLQGVDSYSDVRLCLSVYKHVPEKKTNSLGVKLRFTHFSNSSQTACVINIKLEL